jgi:hypothetical protein
MLKAQSLKLELTPEFAMPASHSEAWVRKLTAHGSKAQSSKSLKPTLEFAMTENCRDFQTASSQAYTPAVRPRLIETAVFTKQVQAALSDEQYRALRSSYCFCIRRMCDPTFHCERFAHCER